jgi:hypothetical protein
MAPRRYSTAISGNLLLAGNARFASLNIRPAFILIYAKSGHEILPDISRPRYPETSSPHVMPRPFQPLEEKPLPPAMAILHRAAPARSICSDALCRLLTEALPNSVQGPFEASMSWETRVRIRPRSSSSVRWSVRRCLIQFAFKRKRHAPVIS